MQACRGLMAQQIRLTVRRAIDEIGNRESRTGDGLGLRPARPPDGPEHMQCPGDKASRHDKDCDLGEMRSLPVH